MKVKGNFAKRLVAIREERDVTQQELAEAIGVTRQSLSLYEAGERTINIELLTKICAFFQVPSDYLLGLSDVLSYDTEKQAVSRYLGISENAIERIKKATSCRDKSGNAKEVTNKFIENHLGTVIILLRRLDSASKDIEKYGIKNLVEKYENENQQKEWKSIVSRNKDLERYRFSLYAERICDDFDNLVDWGENFLAEEDE